MSLSYLLSANAALLAGTLVASVFVARRRARVYALVEHLAALVRRALPLSTGLRQVGADLGGVLGGRLARIARHLEEGRSLAEAVRAVPGVFPPLLGGLLSAGERCGNLGGALETLRAAYRERSETSGRAVYFFLYPVFLSLFVTSMLAAMGATFIPKMTEIFEQVGVPWQGFEKGWSWLAAANQAVFAVCAALAAFILLGGGSSHFGGAPAERLALAVPILGRVLREAACARFARCAGLVLEAGGGVAEAVEAAAAVERAGAARLARVAARVRDGARLSAAARAERAFPDAFLWFVEAGEASGALAPRLLEAAGHFEARARFAAHAGSRAVIPAFVIVNGVLVLFASSLTLLPLRALQDKVLPW